MNIKTTFFKISLVLFVFFSVQLSFSQDLSMVNIAGKIDAAFTPDVNALESGIGQPAQIAIDKNGDIYFGVVLGSETGVYRIEAETNIITRVLGANMQSLTGLAVKDGIIFLSFGSLSIKDNNYIYYVDLEYPDVFHILAGNGTSDSAPASEADAHTHSVGNVGGLKLSPDGEYLYYSSIFEEAGYYYNYIQKVCLGCGPDNTDTLTYRVAGQALPDPVTEVADGTLATSAELNLNLGLAWDSEGNLYFATGDNKIKMVHYEGGIGYIYHVAGNGETDYDPSETEASEAAIGINNAGFDINDSDQLILCDNTNLRILQINLQPGPDTEGETIEVFAGTGYEEGQVGSDPANDLDNYDYREPKNVNIGPRDLIVAENDEILFTDQEAYRLRRIFTCENPEISSSAIDKDIICKGDQVTMSFEGELNDGTTWKWFDEACGEGVISGENTKSLTVTANESTTYYAIGSGGCANNEICTEFKVDVTCAEFFNAFSPNGDGVNDFLEIPALENFPANTVVVYNRWGQILEQIENYDNLSAVWKGTNGENDPVDSGTYYFTAEVNGELVTSGWVQVIK